MVERFQGLKPEFFAALGQFIYQYAEIEHTIGQILRVSMNLSAKTAFSIFGGTRVRGAIDHIKRYHEAHDRPLPSRLKRAFDKIGELTTAQDKLLHYGFLVEHGSVIVTDRFRNTPKRAREFPISLDDLKNLTEDAHTARACLIVYWVRERHMKQYARYKGWEQIADRQWLYTLPSLTAPKKITRKRNAT